MTEKELRENTERYVRKVITPTVGEAVVRAQIERVFRAMRFLVKK